MRFKRNHHLCHYTPVARIAWLVQTINIVYHFTAAKTPALEVIAKNVVRWVILVIFTTTNILISDLR